MSKVSEYLGKNLSGEVTVEPSARQYFSTDGSFLKYVPQVVIYPRTTDDIRKTTRFAWRLAEKGYKLPITARGYGADMTGASIGSGAVMVFPAHMQKILELDAKLKKVRVQPGINIRTLQEVLATHGLMLPTYPTNMKYATVGGAVADNVSGPKGLKYGTMRNWTDQLEVILANGEVIQTGRISKRELNAKKGLQTLEGEIYRELDGVLTDNEELIAKHIKCNMPDNTGYQLGSVKDTDGSFDLTPLIVGSQGTLAIISQVILNLVPKPVDTALLAVILPSLDNFSELVEAINEYSPSELEFIDGDAIEWIEEHIGVSPLNTLDGQTGTAGVLIVEFDDGDGKHSKSARKVMKMLDEYGAIVELAESQDDKEDIWGSRYGISALFNSRLHGTRAVQFADAIIPIQKMDLFVENLRKLINSRKIKGFISGRVGAGNISVTALANMGNIGDRQAVFGFMRDYCKLTSKFGGSIAGDSGDGRLRIMAAQGQYGDEMLGVFEQVKEIFDPKGVLNPGVILGSTEEELIQQIDSQPEPRFLDYRPRI